MCAMLKTCHAMAAYAIGIGTHFKTASKLLELSGTVVSGRANQY
jgi:hypothetical protein